MFNLVNLVPLLCDKGLITKEQHGVQDGQDAGTHKNNEKLIY